MVSTNDPDLCCSCGNQFKPGQVCDNCRTKRPERINVLDDIGFVELLQSMGNDLTVANSARASYAKESRELNERDKRLIARMMREHHGSPFEHEYMTFRVKAPLFVVQQWERHRIASYSE